MKKTLLALLFVATSSLFAADGATLYKKCAVCHGAKAEKKALNKSQIIQGWSVDNLVASMKGYQAGTYGGALKGTMKGQVANLKDEDIKALAEYIAGLK
ncbi:MAG TPA: cytochrome C [Sulfurospirillum sp. UBA11407]|jgi:cytochrome c553|nr:MAG TPA: cytochrome C [Sulfurospirillum sp. UBA11407]